MGKRKTLKSLTKTQNGILLNTLQAQQNTNTYRHRTHDGYSIALFIEVDKRLCALLLLSQMSIFKAFLYICIHIFAHTYVCMYIKAILRMYIFTH